VTHWIAANSHVFDFLKHYNRHGGHFRHAHPPIGLDPHLFVIYAKSFLALMFVLLPGLFLTLALVALSYAAIMFANTFFLYGRQTAGALRAPTCLSVSKMSLKLMFVGRWFNQFGAIIPWRDVISLDFAAAERNELCTGRLIIKYKFPDGEIDLPFSLAGFGTADEAGLFMDMANKYVPETAKTKAFVDAYAQREQTLRDSRRDLVAEMLSDNGSACGADAKSHYERSTDDSGAVAADSVDLAKAAPVSRSERSTDHSGAVAADSVDLAKAAQVSHSERSTDNSGAVAADSVDLAKAAQVSHCERSTDDSGAVAADSVDLANAAQVSRSESDAANEQVKGTQPTSHVVAAQSLLDSFASIEHQTQRSHVIDVTEKERVAERA
jgi:hypothetical protein